MTKEEADLFDSRKDRDWLNPIAMSELQRAVKAQKTEVVLNGEKFVITYGFRRTFPASNETVDSIQLKRADGTYIPFAYIPLKRIMNFDFERGS